METRKKLALAILSSARANNAVDARSLILDRPGGLVHVRKGVTEAEVEIIAETEVGIETIATATGTVVAVVIAPGRAHAFDLGAGRDPLLRTIIAVAIAAVVALPATHEARLGTFVQPFCVAPWYTSFCFLPNR